MLSRHALGSIHPAVDPEPPCSFPLLIKASLMSFSLFRCGDTYVVVPATLSPSIDAVREFGRALFVRATPKNLYESTEWDSVSHSVDDRLFAVLSTGAADRLFNLY